MLHRGTFECSNLKWILMSKAKQPKPLYSLMFSSFQMSIASILHSKCPNGRKQSLKLNALTMINLLKQL